MNRRDFIKLTTLGLASAAWSRAAGADNPAPGAAGKPNVLFILADDLGWVDTRVYGSRYYRTPNVDALAGRGMRFTNAYAANPLCSPTRASIMTGLWPARIGITAPVCHVPQVQLEETVAKSGRSHQPSLSCQSATRLKTEYYTLAEAFRDAGYATGHFGKWHLGAAPYSPLEQGFDVDVPHTSGPGPAGRYVAPWKYPRDFTPGSPDEHIEDRMAREAVRFMKECKARGKPFFMNYWMFSVHAPFDAKKAYIEQWAKQVDPADPQHNPVYAAMVQSMDDAVGTLVKALDAEGLAGNTIIVFTSDNGGNTSSAVSLDPYGLPVKAAFPTSNHPLRGGKANIYEGGTREPLVVVWPGKVKPGSVNDRDIVQSIDFYPTLAEITGLKPKAGQTFDGISIVPALTGGALARDTIFCHFPHYTPATGNVPSAYVRKGDWKLIRFFNDNGGKADRHELYNLKADLGERRDLAAAQPERVKELGALLNGFLKESGARVPGPNPAYDATAAAPAPSVGARQVAEPDRPVDFPPVEPGKTGPKKGGRK